MSAANTKSIPIFDRDTLLHLRIPFSFFLFPVFCFGISQAPALHIADTIILFIVLHLFIYPASNIYNSYMDKDTGSIGGLKHPPPVTRKLYTTSIFFDITGLILCCIVSWKAAILVAVYILFSKAYSWHGIRLKKYPIISWLVVMFFQGGYIFMLSGMTAGNQYSVEWFTPKNMECMLIASLLIGGSYPLTQIYQHEEDHRRGDRTLSYILGIRGTFFFTLIFFISCSFIAFHYFVTYYTIRHLVVFMLSLLPAMIYFSSWLLKTLRNNQYADHEHVMLMNKIASSGTTAGFITLFILNHF